MARVIIPISNNQLSNTFSDCSYYEIFEINGREVVGKNQILSPASDSDGFTHWMHNAGITDIIAHGINRKLVLSLSDTKVNMFLGVDINYPESLIDEYLNGTLKSDTNKIFNF